MNGELKDDKAIMHALSRAKKGTTELNNTISNMKKSVGVVHLNDKSIDTAADHYYRVRVSAHKHNTSASKAKRYGLDRLDNMSSSDS